ncbi:MAG: PTS fructose transporter subunit IIA [Rhodobacteraceae bacterium]|nr:MAG: PTS fructose transporter subunit IIA [Paracoccaceae bacterium]
MLGIVIVAHGGLAIEYLSAVEHILGVKPKFQAISIYPNDNIDEKEMQIKSAISEVEDGSGVIIVTDMHGSTPANIALKASKEFNCKVLFGVNLPLLVKLVKVRHLGPSEAVGLALEAGKKYIK